ncbi:MAG: AMP-binding protein [Pseudanabaenaceae cyanobacterium bins.68]|nr:AMP-binding protein [Pseudanabaenaceae cyanobacterium bins.68]
MARILDHSQAQSLWQVWQKTAATYPEIVAVHDPHAKVPVKLTYAEILELMQKFGAGLRALGAGFGDKIALIADNSARWLIADQGILAIGAANATRSSQTERQELLYILEHSDSSILVVENLETLEKLKPELHSLGLRAIILLSDQAGDGIYNFNQLLELGASKDLGTPPITPQTLATLIYTSGTGGKPKGVMLSHGNLLYELNAAPKVYAVEAGKIALSILPTWHSYERTFEYFVLGQGCSQIYTNIRMIKKDLQEYQPHYMVAVPRLWESIYEGIQKQFREQPANKQKLVNFFLNLSRSYVVAKRTFTGLNLANLEPDFLTRYHNGLFALLLYPLHKLGDRLVYAKVRQATGGKLELVVSGGGSIADHLEDFYEIVGINILGGYGLTETAPITHVRRPQRNIRGGDGQPLEWTETKIVDPETRQPLPPGHQGLVLLRGPQVMQGYYKNPESTAKAIDPDGWFDSGDLGWITRWQDLIITGRAKDTIVLSNGENIEPQPLEDVCSRSVYIDQIVIVGQDQKCLAALIVPNLAQLASDRLIPEDVVLAEIAPQLNQDQQIKNLLQQELNREIKNRPGFRPDDRISLFACLPEPFTIENGLLTQTYKIKRNQVNARYADLIEQLFRIQP